MKAYTLLAVFLLWYYFSWAQQSNVNVKESKGTKIAVEQISKDSSPKSVIKLEESDSNTIQVIQRNTPTKELEKEKVGFFTWLENTDNLLKVLISVATLIGLTWSGIQYIKKRKKKKKK